MNRLIVLVPVGSATIAAMNDALAVIKNYQDRMCETGNGLIGGHGKGFHWSHARGGDAPGG